MWHVLDFPLNTKRMYSMATTYNGCEVYFPIDARDMNTVNTRKKEVQDYFNSLTPEVLPLDLA